MVNYQLRKLRKYHGKTLCTYNRNYIIIRKEQVENSNLKYFAIRGRTQYIAVSIYCNKNCNNYCNEFRYCINIALSSSIAISIAMDSSIAFVIAMGSSISIGITIGSSIEIIITMSSSIVISIAMSSSISSSTVISLRFFFKYVCNNNSGF